MGKFVIACTQGSEVKIVHGVKRWNATTLKSIETVPEKDLDEYLDREKLTEFSIICDFDESFHDVIYVPSLKKKYLKKVIESEIRKTTQKTGFTFIYSILGEQVVDNKNMLEVFYFMVTNDVIRKVVERYYDHGKIVKALYPAVFTAASLLERSSPGGIKMGMVISDYKRIVFTTKNGSVNFIRDYDSLETSVSDFDIQNVNMTLNYCTKNLRMTPESISFLGDVKGLSEIKTKPDIPIMQPDMPDDLDCNCKAGCGYPLPCATFDEERASSILSEEFNNIYILRRLMEGASVTFVMLTLVYLALIFYLGGSAFETRKEMQAVVNDVSGAESVYEEYRGKQETINGLMPVVSFLNSPSADISGLLTGFSRIELRDLSLVGIDARAEGKTSYFVSINGKGLSGTYSDFQGSFDRLLAGLEKIEGVKLVDRVINHMDKTFSVQLSYGK